MKEAVIVSVARTPMAKFRGDFANLAVPALGAIALNAVVKKAKISPEQIDEVIMGNLFGSDWGNPARACVLEAGFPTTVPAITVDRQCASSLNAIALAAAQIQTGTADIILTGGVESYSQQPIYVKRPNSAFPATLEVTGYKTSIPGGAGNDVSMIQTAENLAKIYQISREECDAFAIYSHKKAAAAWENGFFDEQVVPVSIQPKKSGPVLVETDVCVRKDASMEVLSRLKPVLYADGVVTAGNASPMNDGSSAVLIMSREKAQVLGMDILAVVREYASAGCDPEIMGIGPVHSTRKLMGRYGYKIGDFDLVELNEAFASQSLACIKELGLNLERVNVEGGAIAIGHPNGASGGMLVARMVYALRRRSLRRGLVSFCCGGGQGVSLVLENPEA